MRQCGTQPLGVQPRLARRLGDDVAPPLAVEPQREPGEPRRQQLEPWPELAPQRHEPEVRDVAVHERKDSQGLVVGMEPDRLRPPAAVLDRQRDLRPIPPLLDGLDDLRVGDIQLADASQRVPHDGPLGRELRIVCQVLELAAAAPVAHIVRTRRRNPCVPRCRCHDLPQLRPREVLVQPHTVSQPDAFSRRGPGHEHRSPVRQAPHAIASRRDGRDRDDLAHPPMPSRRAASVQADGRAGGGAAGGAGAARVRCSSASNAAAIASGWVSSEARSAASSRSPTRSR